MIKTFSQVLDFTSTNVIARDLKTFEDTVNSFLTQAGVIERDTTFATLSQAGVVYILALTVYDKKPS